MRRNTTSAVTMWSRDLLVMPFWETSSASLVLSESQAAVDGVLDGALAELISTRGFTGAAGSSAVMVLPNAEGNERLAIVGMGKENQFQADGAAKFGAALAKVATDQKAERMAVEMPALDPPLQQAVLEATLLGLSLQTRYVMTMHTPADSGVPVCYRVRWAGRGGGASNAVEFKRHSATANAACWHHRADESCGACS